MQCLWGSRNQVDIYPIYCLSNREQEVKFRLLKQDRSTQQRKGLTVLKVLVLHSIYQEGNSSNSVLNLSRQLLDYMFRSDIESVTEN